MEKLAVLLQISDSLEELLVRKLAQKPSVTARTLHALLGKKYSLRSVYNELSLLEREGVVTKIEDRYSLRLVWILRVQSFVDLLQSRYLTPEALPLLLSRSPERLVWNYSDLARLDMAWTQLTLSLHAACPGKAMCIWCPYQWFDLSHGERNKQFSEANDLAGHRPYHIIGGPYYLNTRAEKNLPKSGSVSFAESPFEPERSTYYTAIGDYVITVKLDSATTERLHDLFSRVKNERQLEKENLFRIFKAPVRAKLIFEHHERKASKLKRKFAKFFGVKLNSLG